TANLYVSGPVLAIWKTADVADVTVGGTVNFKIDYANVGNQTANLTYIGDTIPTGYTFNAPPASTTGCVGTGVITINVTSGGSGYSSAPGVSVVGGGGSGATATATITGGVVTAITVNTPGSGYTNPTISFSGGGGGSGAAATPVIGVACTGLGTLAPGVTAATPINLNFTVGATAANPSINTASVNASNAASVTAQFSETPQTTTCVVGNTTNNYYFLSTQGAVSTGATYGVAYVTMGAGGTGYASAPTVSFTGGGGSGAAGTAIVNAGAVIAINVTNPGTGYTSAPTVGFTGGGGTGAGATAVLTSGGEYLARTTLPASDTTVSRNVINIATELARFYSDPVDTTTAYVVSTATVTTNWDPPVPGNSKLVYSIKLDDFDTVGNTETNIASVGPFTSNNGGTFSNTFTVPANTVLKAGHRLVWVVYIQDPNPSSSTTDALHINGGTSFGTVCLLPIHPSLTKNANKLAVNVSGTDTIAYTLTAKNTSTTSLTTVKVYDPLPTGMTFNSATVPGGTTATNNANTACPTTVATNCVIWTIGTLTAGTTDTATINATVASTITGTTATNTATLTDDQTPNTSATYVVDVLTPNVLIQKVVSPTGT
ncbi:MAG TPA: hypothetical protein VHU41_13860, partial [Thermoanaerobaculia bacterium]|nr:hypothetical protein [Thermoanaerobaculia bacterium]